jgi:isocitrate dehydrogenase
MILKNYNIDKKEIIDLVKQKEIRETISPESIMSKWQIAKKEKTKDLQRVYYKETIPDTNIENMLKNFSSFSPIYVKNIPES